jgi:ferredoxin-NADP reductase
MNDRWPQSLNDDRVRTYAVSKISPGRRQISITVAKAGLVSSYLHMLKSPVEPFEATIKGFGGTFTCFEGGQALPHMLWVAGGVGITPFLAMYRALRESGRPIPGIDLAYACRLEEVNLLRALAGVRVRLFDSKAHAAPAGDAAWQFYRRRMEAADFSDDTLLARATVFVCGPDALMANVTSWLEGRVEPGRLRLERFHA